MDEVMVDFEPDDLDSLVGHGIARLEMMLAAHASFEEYLRETERADEERGA